MKSFLPIGRKRKHCLRTIVKYTCSNPIFPDSYRPGTFGEKYNNHETDVTPEQRSDVPPGRKQAILRTKQRAFLPTTGNQPAHLHLLGTKIPGRQAREKHARIPTDCPLVQAGKKLSFCGSHEGAKCAAIFYSLISSAANCGHHPFEYLRDELQRLPEQPLSQLDELLPPNWVPAKGVDD